MSKYLIIDSREKPKAIGRILKQFDEAGIRYETSKLLFGDYMDYSRPHIVIDRKQNIAELAKNCTVESSRFRAELERASAAGAELIILVEQNRQTARLSATEIRTYYKAALQHEANALVHYLVKEVVCYDDKIEIYFNSPIKMSPDENRGFFVSSKTMNKISVIILIK